MNCFGVRCSIVALGMALSGLSQAQFLISNETSAVTVGGLDRHTVTYTGASQWESVGKTTELFSSAPIHPWDPGDNTCESWSRYVQPDYGLSTYKAKSMVLSDYRGAGGLDDYESKTEFFTSYELWAEGLKEHEKYAFVLAIPVHGIFSARGYDPMFGTAFASADFSVGVEVNGAHAARSGSLLVESSTYDGMSHSETGEFAGQVTAITHDMATRWGSRQVNAIELSALAFVNLGHTINGGRLHINMDFSMSTHAKTGGSIGSYGLADMSATSGYEIWAYDENGNRVYDFTVGVVPEPAIGSFAFLALGLGWLSRKKRG